MYILKEDMCTMCKTANSPQSDEINNLVFLWDGLRVNQTTRINATPQKAKLCNKAHNLVVSSYPDKAHFNPLLWEIKSHCVVSLRLGNSLTV